jgi:hypothetical protein
MAFAQHSRKQMEMWFRESPCSWEDTRELEDALVTQEHQCKIWWRRTAGRR